MQSIPISNFENQESSFPTQLNLENHDYFTSKTIKEGLTSTVAHNLPYYVIAIVKTVNSNNRSLFNIFEATPLYMHLIDCLENESFFYDPKNQLHIQSIHYFALSCLKPTKENIFESIKFDDPSLIFTPLQLPYPFPTIKPRDTEEDSSAFILNELVDSLNYHTLSPENSEGCDEDEIILREKQLYIANNIETFSLFKEFSQEQKEMETIKWLWCSTQSKHGRADSIMDLANRYRNYSLWQYTDRDQKELLQFILKKILNTPLITQANETRYKYIQMVRRVLDSLPNSPQRR